MAEGEIVGFGAAGHGEERDDVGAGCGRGRGDGEVCADDGDECGEGDEGVEVPVEGAAVGGGVEDAGGGAFGAGEDSSRSSGRARAGRGDCSTPGDWRE